MSLSRILDKIPRPTGGVPPWSRPVLVTGAALAVIAATYMSSRSQSKRPAVEQKQGIHPEGPSRKEIEDTRRLLAARERELEDVRKRAAPLTNVSPMPATQASGSGAGPVYVSAPKPVDPLKAERERREYLSLFASNIAVSYREKANEARPAPKAEDKPPTIEKSRQESGRLLPPIESGLFRVYEGTGIDTQLTNRLDGTFSGPVRCLVVSPVYSQDSSTLLVPVGATLLGEAKKVEQVGERRLAIAFHRLLLPNGYSVPLAEMPGLSGEGETGLSDKVNNHYLRTFGLAGALGVISGFALSGTRSGFDPSGWDSYGRGVSSSEANAATRIIDRYLNLPPTITIREGHRVMVYLTKDLLLPAYTNPQNAGRKD